MFKIGDVSGLVEAKDDKKKSPIKVVGDIVEDMAKKCCHVPKKMRAPSKLVECTNGCFSSAQVITISDDLSGSNGDEDAENASDVSSDAASTGGGCGGGKTPQPVQPSSGCCGKKSSCGGSQKKYQDPRTGQKLCGMVVPQTVDDFLSSDYSDKLKQEQAAETEFRGKYCVLEPYPECKSCPYRVKNLQTQPRDINAVFSQIREVIQTLQQGNYSLATKMFECPGQAHDLMTGAYRTMAEVAVPTAVSLLINLTAARGALEAFEGLATAAEYTDFRREVLASVDKLFRSGAKIGIPKAFTDEIGEILTKIGCSANQLIRLSAIPLSSRDTRYGQDYNLYGSRCCGRNPVNTPYKTESRRMPSVSSIIKAEAALAEMKPALDKADDLAEMRPVVQGNTPTSTSASATVTAQTNDVQLPEAIRVERFVPPEPAARIKPSTIVRPVTPTKDKVAKDGKTYLIEVEAEGATDKYVPVPVPITRGTDLEQIAAKYGRVFETPDNGIYVNPTPVETTVAEGEKLYYRKLPGGELEQIVIYPGEEIPIDDQIFEVARTTEHLSRQDVESHGNDLISTPDKVILDKTTMERVDVPYNNPVGAGTYAVVSIVPESKPMSGHIDGAINYTGEDLCVLDGGLIMENPVVADASSLTMTIDTKALVTKTGVRAGDMSTIKDLGISQYELKMAYILDNELNDSVLPEDVTGTRIQTVLDEIEDMD